jgi:hypothetical protein
MPRVFLTYTEEDNERGNVDLIAQELRARGLTVILDRWSPQEGHRLWEQIEGFISNPRESDAWLFLATHNSLGSEACKEEYAIALNRVRNDRGKAFPVIALLQTYQDYGLLPPSIQSRLCITMTDRGWKKRVVTAVERRKPRILRRRLKPFRVKVHDVDGSGLGWYAIEVRPTAGVWTPVVIAIPASEKDFVQPHLLSGPRNAPPYTGTFEGTECFSVDQEWWMVRANGEATSRRSYYVFCSELPSELYFGQDGSPAYHVRLGLAVRR